MMLRGFNEDNDEDIDEIKQLGVNLLLSLLEGSANMEIIKRMTQSLDDF